MTPAERASAVAFALKNCALEAMTPGDATMRAAADYERGDIDVARLIEIADESTARKIQSNGRLSDGSLDDHATDHADSVFARTVLLAERRWPASGDLAELTAIHRGLFEGVFADAGALRTSDTTREATDDKARARNPEAFFPAALIETGALNIATELADKRNLQVLDRDVFVREFTRIYDELGYLHPFKGGNAMVLRMFGSRLAHDAGWDLDWGSVTREGYKSAKHAAYRGDTDALERMFAGIVRPANPTRVFLIAGWDQGPAH
ncbi:Fic family protein [Bifidobacterium eulemuris]|uniref:protein adenylyltransferase n=2 Tax=Bifidobacterium eulemuris TaxID=1765219 RepID=A0A7L9SS38_9BIFI|nr:Fic family protein [Bifidobacterium eulemuris]QOL33025.1 Fic family protein [Bifidobacterium eulemuris]